MLPIKCILAWSAAVLFGLVSNNVRADSSAFVAFGGLEVTLFDLDPSDGIDPLVTLDLVERSGSAFQYPFPDASWPPLREERVTGSGSAALSDANGSSSLVLLDASMEGTAVSTGGGAYTALLTDSFTFTLTPYTRIVFSALTDAAVSAERIQSALAVITLAGQSGSLPGEFASFEASNVRFESGTSAVPIAVETSSAAGAVSGNISLRAYAYAGGVSPVPWPGQYAMLMAGLLVLAAARLRWRHRIAGWRQHGARKPGALAARRVVRVAALCTAAAGSAMVSGMAQASSGSASIYDFAYELYDLAPADGVTPSLVFTSSVANGTVQANMNTMLGHPWDETRTLSSYGTEAIVKQQGRALVELSADAVHASALAWRGAFSASGVSDFEFTLTPMTRVVFSAMAELLVAHDPANRPDASEASAGLSGELLNFPGQRTQFSSFVMMNTPGESARPLAVHALTGSLAGSGTIRVSAGTFAVGVSPIPEPASWSMLLAGIVFGSLFIRSRQRRLRT